MVDIIHMTKTSINKDKIKFHNLHKSFFSELKNTSCDITHNHVIIYDNSPLFSSARCWFMLRYFGHKNISIFQGGINEWKKNGGKTQQIINSKQKGNFVAGPLS